MDLVSHALWGSTIIRRKPYVWWALFFGAAPDLLGSGPGVFYLLLVQHRFWSSTTWPLLPQALKDNYHFWHGLLATVIVFLAIVIIKQKAWFLILPYLLHIGMDLFTHVTDVSSSLFFPFVKYNSNRLISLNWWEHSWILAINILLLVIINLYLWSRKNKNASLN